MTQRFISFKLIEATSYSIELPEHLTDATEDQIREYIKELADVASYDDAFDIDDYEADVTEVDFYDI